MSLSTYSTKELQKKLKSQKILFIVQIVLVILMVVFAILSTAEKGVSFQTFLPLFFAPMALVMYLEMQKIKKELNSRN